MPPLPGEERLVTLFADVHYYFSKPSPRPTRHRFDKSSYFYIYYNPTRRTSRIEIANHPGTEFQDAVYGHLDRCRITNPKRFPTLTTIEVEAVEESKATRSSSTRDADEWRLDSVDSRESWQEKHQLHTLDIYFWTQEDARLVAGFFTQLLPSSQLDLANRTDAEQDTQHNTMSPVVQNLENVAVSDPAYRNGQTRNSQNQPQAQKQSQPIPPPPPPPSQPRSAAGTRPESRSTAAGRTDSSDSRHEATNYTPVTYNPAAPAAPEPRVHREKTPPPEDDGHGTGLKTAATHDAGYQSGSHAGTYQPQPQHRPYGAPPTTTTPGYASPSPSVGYGSPPPRQQTATASTTSAVPSFAPPPSSSSAGTEPRTSQNPSGPASFAAPPTNTTVTTYDPPRHSVAAETYIPDHPVSHDPDSPLETPGAQFYNTLPTEKQPLKHVRPKYPEYFPQQPLPYNHPNDIPTNTQYNDPYAIHHQVYRPTTSESHGHGHSSHHRPSKGDSRHSSTTPASPPQSGSGDGTGGGTFSRLKGLGKSLGREADRKINGYVDRVEKGKFA